MIKLTKKEMRWTLNRLVELLDETFTNFKRNGNGLWHNRNIQEYKNQWTRIKSEWEFDNIEEFIIKVLHSQEERYDLNRNDILDLLEIKYEKIKDESTE